MQNNKYMSMLGLARRAGSLAMGHDMVLEAVRKRKAKLLLIASDISPRHAAELERATQRYGNRLPCITLRETIDDLHAALGYRAGVIAVNDVNFANRIHELINES